MTDTDIMKWLKEEQESDRAFMQGNSDNENTVSDDEYKAYQHGQTVGARRVLNYLRLHKILKPAIRCDGSDKIRIYQF